VGITVNNDNAKVCRACRVYWVEELDHASERVKLIAQTLQSSAGVDAVDSSPLYMMQADKLLKDSMLRELLVQMLCTRSGDCT
jgi:hypothetical protein